MASRFQDADYQWLAGSGICPGQSAVWARRLASLYPGTVASYAVAAAAKCEADSRGGRSRRRESVVRSELGLGSSQSMASRCAGYSGEKVIAGNSRSIGRSSAEPSRRATRRADLMATSDTRADLLRQVYSGDRQSPVRLAATLALGCTTYSSSSPVRAAGPGVCHSSERGQSPVWDATRVALGHARAVANHATEASTIQKAYSRICPGWRGQSPVWTATPMEHSRAMASQSAHAACSGFTRPRVCTIGQSPIRDAARLALAYAYPMASGYADCPGGKTISRHTGSVGRSTTDQINSQLYYPGQGVGTDHPTPRAAALFSAAVCIYSGRQSPIRDAARLALYGINRSLEAGRPTPQGTTEDFAGGTATAARRDV